MKTSSRNTIRRAFSAILLLMVMALQVGVKSLHLHHYAETEHVSCSDCDHHRFHNGHLLSWNNSSSDCVVCQLFSSPFTETQDVLFKAIPAEQPAHYICSSADITSTVQMHIVPRAPPTNLL